MKKLILIYYKIYIALATKPWSRIIIQLIIFYGLFYIISQMFSDIPPPPPPASEFALVDLEAYKELLANYESRYGFVIDDTLTIVNFVIEVTSEMEVDFWSPTPEVFDREDNQPTLYVRKYLSILPQLAEHEKEFSLNYLSIVLTSDYTQLYQTADEHDISEFFHETKKELVIEASKIDKAMPELNKVEPLPSTTSIILAYSLPILVALAIVIFY
jgi:hypothetical protein